MRKNLDCSARPVHYELFIWSEESSFGGDVRMFLTALSYISAFQFNSKELALNSVKVFQQEREIPCSYRKVDEEFVEVALDSQVQGEFQLVVKYEGVYGTLDGFYKSQYNGTDIFATQFEPTDARKAFPCFDQPDMKATFSIKIKAPKKNTILSNEAVASEEETETHKIATFKKTPKMSTYIVAWAIGQLDYIEVNNGIPIRVYAMHDELVWGRFALEIGDKCLRFFENYFEIKYPLSKIDMVAIPAFASGAMENWGLITFRKTGLLWNPETSLLRSKQNIANTVCHELAHMWFGNLVTMKWWNDLWLNEGFATWASSLAMHSIDMVDWDVWTTFAADDIEYGMKADCLENTHEIAVEVDDPDQIDQIFDQISYNKGSSVIKMLENWIGPESFRKGLVKYLNEKKYDNAETENLWSALDQFNETAISISDLMSSWISQGGFPLVEVAERNGSLVCTQQMYTKGFKAQGRLWPIPMKIRWFHDGNEEEVESIVMEKETLTIPMKSSVYKFNDDVSGFYRVKYISNMPERLFEKRLSNINKLNLFSDLFDLAFALKTEFPLELTRLMAAETNYEVLSTGLGSLCELKSAFYDNEEIVNKIKKLINSVIESPLKELDLKNPPTNTNDLATMSYMTILGIRNGSYTVDSEDIHQEFRRSYFYSKVDKDFDSVKHFYLTSTLPGIKEVALMALGTVNHQHNYELLVSDLTFVKPHDFFYICSSLGHNIRFRNAFAEYFMSNYEYVKELISDPGMFRHCFEMIFSEIHQEELRDKVLEFIESKKTDTSLTRAINTIKDSLKSTALLRSAIIASRVLDKE